ncbi:hypothetical protein PSEUBRA_001913 [Kalmanozyma brasiliensis GHG001]|uniref:uncharacterized protein n=1 Tax=Kalmanozyma brasiliensis (strain GHG001) TaxID=1365824 RepID=UPI002867DF13|nr:uncharacterized protein PSEUBRA_001913 [Kalmanozyma brasiliensis GHG001]KAF6767015.1 hypothetical protein PSEUBRA_001913 [Kalmanozyma brasiliensis GHG001]
MSDPNAHASPWSGLSWGPYRTMYVAYYKVKATELGAAMEAVINLPDLQHVIPRLDKDALTQGELRYTLTVRCDPCELDIISFVRHAEKIAELEWVKRHAPDRSDMVLKDVPQSKILESILDSEHAPVDPKAREQYLQRFFSIDLEDGLILRMPARGDKLPHQREADAWYEALLDRLAWLCVKSNDKDPWCKIRSDFNEVFDGLSSVLQRRAKFSELHVIEGPDPYEEYEQD